MKLKFISTGEYGGGMTGIEAYHNGYQVIISDGDGGLPVLGDEWIMGIYVKDADGDWECDALAMTEGKNYSLDKARSAGERLLTRVIKKEIKNLERKIKELKASLC